MFVLRKDSENNSKITCDKQRSSRANGFKMDLESEK